MAVRIIRDDERFEKQIDGATFFYRRVPAKKQSQVQRKHTNRRGDTDWNAVGIEILQWAILDWRDVIDTDGSALAYDIDLVSWLPNDTQVELIEACSSNIDHVESDIKNSLTSQNSNSLTKGEPAKRVEKSTT